MANNLQRRASFGLFEFDTHSGELRRDGIAVKLANQPARVLALLLTRPGEVIGRDEFRRDLWGDDTFVDFERGLNFCIAQARAALGDSSDNPRFIQTVPRRGYRFIAPVAFQGLSPAQVQAPHIRRRPAVRWIATVMAAATVLGVVWLGLDRPGSSAPAVETVTRVAVLPFLNLTGDPGLDYVADGLTDEVITQLGALSRTRLAVVARTSVMRYRSNAAPLPEIASALDVQHVIEGSVRREGDALRVSSRVVAVQSQTANASSDDLFDSPAAPGDVRHTPVAIRMARHIAMALLPEAGLDADAPPAETVDAGAWHLFLESSASLHRGTPEEILRAVAQLEAAVERDPNFAAAWARLAEARHLLVMMGAIAPGDAYPPAQLAAERALAASPDLATAHLARGLVELWFHWRPAEAARAFERALTLNPSLAAAHHDHAWALVALGRTDDAIRHIERARALDPLSTRANNDVGWLRLFVRQPADAARACEHTLAIDAGSLEAQACLERAYAQQRQFDAALAAARATRRRADTAAASATGHDALLDLWRRRLQQLERAAEARWVNPYTLAVHYALVDDRPRALAALEQAYRARVGMLVFLARDPAMDALRGDPRFEALVAKVNATSS